MVNIIEGQPLTLPCVLLAGNPLPERRWIKNNLKVSKAVNRQRLNWGNWHHAFASCKISLRFGFSMPYAGVNELYTGIKIQSMTSVMDEFWKYLANTDVTI